MQYDIDSTGAVQLTLTAHEAERLEEFLHLAAMSLQTWPLCVGEFMTERKERRNLNLQSAAKDGASAGPDS
ncbi:hypothetical protein [Arthrobacter sp. ISL-95]|uniref:hypothetical protein n=1 Tax=Arthrobacter sp. ISL-95 TaxID=2819116 RepID=UPI001BECEDDB|nr:hypothetical protein [Arthrobacter sp. ISL-95]MBT2587979.1 hypothetical protein [Arthrobacter sp. ISL-95]